jgi:hypothetical protein
VLVCGRSGFPHGLIGQGISHGSSFVSCLTWPRLEVKRDACAEIASTDCDVLELDQPLEHANRVHHDVASRPHLKR